MAAVTHVWHLCHSIWKPFPLETCKALSCSFFCFLTTSLASSYVTLCFRMLRGMLSWHNFHTIDFLLTEECYSKGLQLSLKHPSNLCFHGCLRHCKTACLCSELDFIHAKGTFMALTGSFFWVRGWLCPITCWALFHSSTCTEMWLLGRELRNAVVSLFKRRFANLLRLFGNKRWSSVHPQTILAGHHMVVVKNSHGISRTCQGMLQHFLGGLWSEAQAHDLLGSVREIHALGLWL